MRILVAEDDKLSAYILEATLRTFGYDVIAVGDGVRALEVLHSENPPQLAILDWMMPGIDGLEVCRRVRRAGGPYVYILLLTANSEPSEIVAGIEAGADDYIKKPFNPVELQARLRTGKRIVELEMSLRSLANHDVLTGLMNRGAIVERLRIELDRSRREKSVVSVAILDLDRFKLVNDTHGHAGGDTVLCETAARMRSVLRTYDFIGRYGGEEFVIVFPGCDVNAAATIAGRVLESIRGTPIILSTGGLTVTASMGIASGPQDGDALIRAADDALFRAKRDGRDRICLASP